MDKNYAERIKLRRKIMAAHPEVVIDALEVAKSAVDEFYYWLCGTYLPTRFPKMFQIVYHGIAEEKTLWNSALEEAVPLRPHVSLAETLRRLGSIIEDDLLFLLPADDGDGDQLKAFVTCFPSGFNTRKKLDLKLRDIHTPVPGYKAKLEKSMDRWFSRLEAGTFVRRTNVSSGCPSDSWGSIANICDLSGLYNLTTDCTRRLETTHTKERK